ncbi:peptidoglycan-binding protein [Parafrankia sp. EUN1f]|uniref:peptidoglycan-binding domain-containing protein n=1 Tax=Parafrankia sp. EUN1f TaxID=102897 RepID=UPI0001C45582|nr:peptidoglycan-binding domain-containing protein [Parafrankia sp. EUN1f]EFC86473.1 Peptidoglycan-binding domain 1 protein [Parafrankia sp. EUN1f]
MADLWLPGAQRVDRSSQGLAMLGGPAVAVWHSTETDQGTAGGVARGANMAKWPAHIVWDPFSGETYQLLPANVGGRALVSGNREGRVVIQIEAVGRAERAPLRDSPMVGIDRILSWLDSWGVPRVWPAGSPKAYPSSYGLNNGQRGAWGRSGHFGHSQVPGNDHGDPGLIDASKWGSVAPASTGATYDEPPMAYTLWEGAKDPVQGKYSFVHWVQARLIHHTLRITVDGDFGAKTTEAVKTFQVSRGLKPDGVFGPVTHSYLR